MEGVRGGLGGGGGGEGKVSVGGEGRGGEGGGSYHFVIGLFELGELISKKLEGLRYRGHGTGGGPDLSSEAEEALETVLRALGGLR